MLYIKDAIINFVYEIAMEVYENKDEIYREAAEGLLDDDHEQVDMNIEDIIREMIKDKIK